MRIIQLNNLFPPFTGFPEAIPDVLSMDLVTEETDSLITEIAFALRCYLYSKFKKIMSFDKLGNSVVIYPKAVAPRHIAEKRGQNYLEFINMWRLPVSMDWSRNQAGLGLRGVTIKSIDGDATVVKAVPATIVYDVWFWTLDLVVHDHIAAKLVSQIYEDPTLNLTYDETFPLKYHVAFESITDESTISEKYEKGQYFVQKVRVSVTGWVLSSVTEKVIQTIRLKIYDSYNLDTDALVDVLIGTDDIDDEVRAAIQLSNDDNCTLSDTTDPTVVNEDVSVPVASSFTTTRDSKAIKANLITEISFGLKCYLFTKFKSLMKLGNVSKSVIIQPKNIAQRHMAEKRGQNFLEFINLWKTSVSLDWSRNQARMGLRGIQLPSIDGVAQFVTAVPVKIDFDVWFWTLDLSKSENISDKIISQIYDDPTLDLTYNTSFPLRYHLSLGNIADESTANVKYEKGQYYVVKTSISVTGWVLDTLTQDVIDAIRLKIYDSNGLDVDDMVDMIIGTAAIDDERRSKLILSTGENCSACIN